MINWRVRKHIDGTVIVGELSDEGKVYIAEQLIPDEDLNYPIVDPVKLVFHAMDAIVDRLSRHTKSELIFGE